MIHPAIKIIEIDGDKSDCIWMKIRGDLNLCLSKNEDAVVDENISDVIFWSVIIPFASMNIRNIQKFSLKGIVDDN